MANLFNYSGLKNKPKRNGFDLSRKNIYSISAGELLPVLTEEIIPGDTFDIDLQSFTRSQPMNTAAFARMRQYYDFFFVPYHLLWSRFPNFITHVPNNQISKYSQVGKNISSTIYSPLFDFNSLLEMLGTYSDTYGMNNQPLEPTEYQVANYFDPSGRPYDETTIKLMNYLGYPLSLATGGPVGGKESVMPSLQPYRFLAYQKIYADYYRFSQWEPTDSALFNIDWYDGYTSTPLKPQDFTEYNVTNLDDIAQRILPNSPFTLRYANLKRDLLRGVMPRPQFGETAVLRINQSLTKTFVETIQSDYVQLQGFDGTVGIDSIGPNTGIEDLTVSNGRLTLQVGSPASNKVLSDFNLSSSSLNVLALRMAEAAQKYREITGANSYDYIKQIQSHFGVSPDKGLSHQVTYLGGCVSDLSIDPVTNQNLTGDESPQIYGKGTFATSGKIHFKSNDYGIVMCITHILPISDYNSNRISSKLRGNMHDDWPIPEFDSIGMEPVLISEIPGSVYLSQKQQLSAFGYAPRYAAWKTALDEVHGDFQTIEKQWTISQDFTKYLEHALPSELGDTAIGYKFFKCYPSILDSIFAFGSNKSSGNRTMVSDQFLVNSYFDFRIIRNLDYDGMPY